MPRALLAAVLVVSLAAPVADAAPPDIHAHRGGSVLDGAPAFAEETMPAFRNAWERERVVLELDVKLTKDRVPVVIHDDTLDRTTTCTGTVASVTLAQFKACRSDVLGSASRTAKAPQLVELSTLSEVLAYARDAGATLNLEIKNQPGDDDFDGSSAFADTVMETVIASRFPKERLIVQSFWPPNLDAARVKLPGVALSYLTLQSEGGIEYARARGYQWVSPNGAPNAAFVQRAHALGIKVVPYTLNDPAQVKAAAEAGVDALITDDPVMARKALGRPAPPAASPSPPAQQRPLTVRARLLSISRRRRAVRVRVTVSEAGTVRLRVARGRRTVARRDVRLAAGTTTVTIRVPRRAISGRRVRLAVSGSVSG
jgi:glycerophosphoryl diester phosphodiesterase